MPKGQRILVLSAALVLLLVMYLGFKNPIDSLDDKGIVIISCLIMLSFTTLLAEHFFTRPTDVVASAVSILLTIAPMHSALNKIGLWYWVFFGYNSAALVISVISLLLLDSNKSEAALSNRIATIAKIIAVRFANGKFLYFSLFALCVFFYVDSQSPLFIVLFAYSAILLLIDPKKAIMMASFALKKVDTEVAKLFSVQSGNAFLARIFPNSGPIPRLAVVGFSSSCGGNSTWNTGLVIETYELNEQRWMKILTDESFVEIKEKAIRPAKTKEGAVHLLELSEEIDAVKRLAGIVCEGATINKLRFEYVFNAPTCRAILGLRFLNCLM